MVTLENFPYKKIAKAYLLKDNSPVQQQLKNGTVTIHPTQASDDEPDEVIVLVCRQ
jgi:alpha-L-fucosidase